MRENRRAATKSVFRGPHGASSPFPSLVAPPAVLFLHRSVHRCPPPLHPNPSTIFQLAVPGHFLHPSSLPRRFPTCGLAYSLQRPRLKAVSHHHDITLSLALIPPNYPGLLVSPEPTVSSTCVFCSRSNPLSTRPTFHPSSLCRSDLDTRTPYRVPPIHTALSRRSHLNPRRHPAFPLRRFSAGRPHPKPCLSIPHQPASRPAGSSPSPRGPSLSPSWTPRPPPQSGRPSSSAGSPCSGTPGAARLSNRPSGSPGRRALGPAASRAPRLPAWDPPPAKPPPHRATTLQTYLRVAGRGLR